MGERGKDPGPRRAATPRAARLVLASASPRRLALLRLAGLEPVVRPAGVDERPRPGEDPRVYVERMARAKALACGRAAGEVVLAADTEVVLDGRVLGKPRDAEDAAAMLALLAGRAHEVVTGVAVLDASGDLASRLVMTTVVFAPLGEAVIRSYVAGGEPFGKAGAYAIQGRAAAFVERLEGSWTGVVGLPLVEALALLRTAGVTHWA